jgi:hypothetical protein
MVAGSIYGCTQCGVRPAAAVELVQIGLSSSVFFCSVLDTGVF